MASSKTTVCASRESPVPGHKIRQVWTPEEDRLLSEAVARETQKQGPVSWHKVASYLPGRNNKDCRKRWHYSIANTIRKGTWLREEDEKLREAVELYGARWSKIAEAVGTRNGDQCWKRWYDCLDPRIDKSPWTAEEDAKLLHLVSQTGRNWSDIVHQHFPNRTSLAAKNRYSILRRKQEGSTSRGSSSVRHAKSSSPSSRTPHSSASTPSLSSSPYLGVANTPSTTALSTPEPEFATMAEDWMALTEAEMDELLYHNTMPVGDEWFAGVSSEGDLDQGWVPATGGSSQGESSWAQIQAAGFDCGLVDPQMQGGSSEAVGYGGYYGVPQAQQQHLEIPDYPGFNMLGVYQGEVAVQGMYDASSGLGGQGQMGGWQGGYSTGGW